MSSTVKWDMGGMTLLANASQVIAANATTAFDFGTPDDIDLEAETGYSPGDRLLLILSATRAAGTTSTLAFTIQDAPDSAGSIGTPATAVTAGTIPSMAAGSGAINVAGAVAIKLRPGRTWVRVNAVHGVGGTDSFQCHAALYAVPSNL